MAATEDLKSALRALGGEAEGLDDEQIAERAAKKIYWMRNSIVHYRPAQHDLDLASFDWNILCKSMAGIVLHVYYEVFSA
jgi:hypothetical protein